jgi:hypothetical protein
MTKEFIEKLHSAFPFYNKHRCRGFNGP